MIGFCPSDSKKQRFKGLILREQNNNFIYHSSPKPTIRHHSHVICHQTHTICHQLLQYSKTLYNFVGELRIIFLFLNFKSYRVTEDNHYIKKQR